MDTSKRYGGSSGSMPGYDQGLMQQQRMAMGMGHHQPQQQQQQQQQFGQVGGGRFGNGGSQMMGGYPHQDAMNSVGGGGYNLQNRSISMPQSGNDGLMMNRSSSYGSPGPSFDMSNDFPALGGQQRSEGSNGGQQQQQQQYGSINMGQRQEQDFAIQNEDFPALGGGGSNNSNNAGDGNDSSRMGRMHQQQQSSQQQFFSNQQGQMRMPQQMYQQQQQGGFGGGLDNYGGLNMKKPGQSSPQQSQMQLPPQQQQKLSGNGIDLGGMDKNKQGQQQQMNPVGGGGYGLGGKVGGPSQGPPQPQQQQQKKRTMLPPEQQFGLLGLLSLIRMEDPDRGTLALGTDLTSLGLNLNSSESLHTTFCSPWSDRASTRDPPFNLPQCYKEIIKPSGGSKQTLKASHFAKFQLETLFYIFYAMPRDIVQIFAAQELYNRDWRYHMDHKVWFTQANAKNSGQPQGEPGQFIYFDIQNWERRVFNNPTLASTLQSGFMQASQLFSIGASPTAAGGTGGAGPGPGPNQPGAGNSSVPPSPQQQPQQPGGFGNTVAS